MTWHGRHAAPDPSSRLSRSTRRVSRRVSRRLRLRVPRVDWVVVIALAVGVALIWALLSGAIDTMEHHA